MKKNYLFTLVCIASLTLSTAVFAQDVVLGDADSDGMVTATDARLINMFYAGEAVPDFFDEVAADANCDGAIDIVDVLQVVKASVGTIELHCWQTGDVNGDGEVTIEDANDVLSYAAGNDIENFIAPMADVNHDGVIDTQDAVDIAYAVMNGTSL